MPSVIIHNYYYRYRQYRKNIKDLVNNENYTEARNQLNSLITEHDSYILNTASNSEFSLAENSSIHHANAHLTSFENTGQIHQKDAIINALDEIPPEPPTPPSE